MSEEQIKCPICGTKNDAVSETCKMCQSRLSKKEDGSLKVASPKSSGKVYTMIDIEDPLTRKKLEELTLIPGVTRKKALYLYQSGIHSMDEFLQKAFRGERYSTNYSRTVANKLLLQSLRGKKQEQEIPCPSCDAPNPADTKKCKVCNFDIAADMAALDMGNISIELTESVTEIMDKLDDNEDFDALPEELKAQFAALVDSEDIDFDMARPVNLENLGIDLDEIDEIGEEAVVTEDNISVEPEEVLTEAQPVEKVEESIPEPQTLVVEKTVEMPEEPSVIETASEPEKPVKELTAKEKKVQDILSKKVEQWRKAGYDIEGLDQYYYDVEIFKVKAKETLEKGKIIWARYEKQLEMWREKGFDVSELEPLLNKDIDAFKEKAKNVLKQQKK